TEFTYRAVEGVQLGPAAPQCLPLGFACPPFFLVHAGCQSADDARADVFALHAAADLPRACVVPPLVPPHFCYLSTFAPFAPAVRPWPPLTITGASARCRALAYFTAAASRGVVGLVASRRTPSPSKAVSR